MDNLNYRGKFRYAPEIDPDNEVDRKSFSSDYYEETQSEEYYRPKSVFVSGL
jgi:hypothetical protein